MSFVRSAGCFLSSLLSMFEALIVSAASRFGCVTILDLYFSAYLLISSLTVGIPRSLHMSSFLTYHGAFAIVLRILACIVSILFIWLIAAVPHSGIPYVQIGFMTVLYIFNLFPILNLDFRLVSQCTCLLVVCILSIIDLVCCFHVSCVSKWSPRYLTCPVCVMCVLFSRMFGGICFRSVNVIWLHLLGFGSICLSCSHFSIFVICSCSNLTAVSGLVFLTSTAVSSANVSILLLVVVVMCNVHSIGPKTLPCGTPALMSLTSEYVSLIFITKV